MSTSRTIQSVFVNSQASRSILSRRAQASTTSMVRTSSAYRTLNRGFSNNQDPAVAKLQQAFEEYRIENYDHELVSRFRKEVIRALDRDADGIVTPDDIFRLLRNIGKSSLISRSELITAMGQETALPVDAIRRLM
mmetsp:Transcript_12423/g.17872  ORF Transcript_12423/g.17872 Transcript_12423/m.17872 type:complete len:136 (-) Transcript_12423:149-556(-)|eukprot:CAMPEP_0172417110 /NCGR_PEP_ID=MMETSP1064-20121228/3622_1 /TAXON_ID=202472 /ORGANISM="Aulacoseira subarctica , Strain CCAP 1002/5" /LENGTH=135 /DNA_ID=CAMNT_0013155223 /DNA_START=67 /DNA_END=474 /DNA_ORIENTATION=+